MYYIYIVIVAAIHVVVINDLYFIYFLNNYIDI